LDAGDLTGLEAFHAVELLRVVAAREEVEKLGKLLPFRQGGEGALYLGQPGSVEVERGGGK
jgi:hypothetical protein